MKKILICGATSFVANGFAELLISNGYEVETFSRGKEVGREGGRVRGSYSEIDKNTYLADSYDAVVNFAILKDQSVEENIRYIESLLKMCKEHNVKKLIHFSSIMVYNYHLPVVDESTEIDTLENTLMKGYGEIKIGVDQYLMKERDSLPFELVMVRPGYVLAKGVPCPFIKRLLGGVSIIKGNKKSKQPIVRREDIHAALMKIIETDSNNNVYHFFPTDGMTKYRYAKETVGGMVLTMPKWLCCGVPYLMMKVGVIKPALYSRFEGMYIYGDFRSIDTEKKLGVKFK